MMKIYIATGTQAAYDNLWRKDTNILYVTIDTYNIYLGYTLIFSGDKFKYVVISEDNSVHIITYGINGSVEISLSDYETIDEAVEAINNAISQSYKIIGYITSKDITPNLISSSKVGDVYIVTDEFSVGNNSGQVSSSYFINGISGNSYPPNTDIVLVNIGTSENPIYKFNVLSDSIDLDNYKVKQSPKADPIISGETLDVIDSITQNINGEITATKKTIQLASSSQSGIITKEMYTKIEETGSPQQYCTSNTLGNVSSKIAVLLSGNNFSLVPGVVVVVKFSHTNTSDSPTLKVGNTDAKPIKQYGTTSIGTNESVTWNDNEAVQFVYDGTNWLLLSHVPSMATTSVEGLVKVDNSLSDVSTNPVQNKVIKEELDTKATKVTSATLVNFAGLDSSGNLVDSGYSSGDFITEHQSIPEYTIEELDVPTTGYLKSYRLKKDGNFINGSSTINIPKDFLVKSGSVKTVSTINVPYQGAAVGDKYIDFVINVYSGTSTDQHIYIPVNDLVDVYTEGDGISIVNKSISLKIDQNHSNGLVIVPGGLALSTAIASTNGSGGSSGAITAQDKEKLNSIESGANNYTHPTYTATTGIELTNQTPSFGDTFNISQVISDTLGHITEQTTRTITIPDSTVSSSLNGVGGSSGLMNPSDKEKLDNIDSLTIGDIDLICI